MTTQATVRRSTVRRTTHHDVTSNSTSHAGWKTARVITTAVPTAARLINVNRGDRGWVTTSQSTAISPQVVASSYVGVNALAST